MEMLWIKYDGAAWGLFHSIEDFIHHIEHDGFKVDEDLIEAEEC